MSKAHQGQDRRRMEALAASLVASLGIEGALYVCRANYWHGVIPLLQAGTPPTGTVRR